MELDFFPASQPNYEEPVKLEYKNSQFQMNPLPKFQLNKKKREVDSKYSFVDLDKLLKRDGKKYSIAELKDIARRLGIPVTGKKKEITDLIKLKIDIN